MMQEMSKDVKKDISRSIIKGTDKNARKSIGRNPERNMGKTMNRNVVRNMEKGIEKDIAKEVLGDGSKKLLGTIAFDFDNVIHLRYGRYGKGDIYGDINYPLLEYIHDFLMPKYYICIFSCRRAKQIVEHMNKLNYLGMRYVIKDDKKFFWDVPNIIGVTNRKPPAILYVDDKAHRYTDVDTLKKFLEKRDTKWKKK